MAIFLSAENGLLQLQTSAGHRLMRRMSIVGGSL